MDDELPRPQVPGPAQLSADGAAAVAPGHASGGLLTAEGPTGLGERPPWNPPVASGPVPPSPGRGPQAPGPRRAPAKAAGSTLDLVMPMRVGADGPALFCAHTLVGLSWYYLALLPHLGARYRLYGLQARGLRRPEPLPASIEEMARDYANQIRMVQPAGPYHLLGWSLGGNMAFAVAEELERRGEQVGLLVILDTNLLDLDSIETEPWVIYNLVLAQFGYVPALTPADADPEGRMLEVVRRQPGRGLAEWPEQRLRALQRVIKNNVAVARAHRPGRVHCSLLFFSATRNEPTLAEKLQGWRRFVDGPIEAVELDCDHLEMLLPGPIARLGPALSDRLARAAADSAASAPAAGRCR